MERKSRNLRSRAPWEFRAGFPKDSLPVESGEGSIQARLKQGRRVEALAGTDGASRSIESGSGPSL